MSVNRAYWKRPHTGAPSRQLGKHSKRMVWSFLRKKKKNGRKHNTTDFESCSEAPTRKSAKKLTLKSRSSKDVSPELLKVPFQSCASSNWVILLLAGSKHEDILKILLPNQGVKTPKICLAPNYLHSDLSPTPLTDFEPSHAGRTLLDRCCFPHFCHFSPSIQSSLWQQWSSSALAALTGVMSLPDTTSHPLLAPVNIHHKERSY